MSDEKKTTEPTTAAPTERPRRRAPSRKPRAKREEREFEQRILDIARVTRVMAGGKRMSFRACIVLGDKKGRVGIGLAKGADVTQAIQKAAKRAEKEMIRVAIVRDSIPHRVDTKYGAARIMIKPAPVGTGIKAGSVVRVILELAGVPNAVSKIFGSKNKVNNARATMIALQSFLPSKEKKKKAA